MASTIGQAYVQIMPSTKGIKNNLASVLNKEGSSAVSSSGSKLGGILGSSLTKGLIAVGVATAVAKVVTSAVKTGADLEQQLGGVETLYKNSASTVVKNAQKAWKTAGLSQNDYMKQSTTFAAALLQSLGNDTKAAAKYADMAIVDMSDNANKMGTDITSIQNAYQGFSKQNYTMLDNLKLGYGGTKTEMERLLSDASKLTGKKYDISNLSDVYEAIHVIQKELGVTGTTSKEASTTIEGSFNSMKSSVTNFLGDLTTGNNLKTDIYNMMDSTATFVGKNLLPMIGRVFTSFLKAFASYYPVVVSRINSYADQCITNVANGSAPKIVSKVLLLIGKVVLTLIKCAPQLMGAGAKLAISLGSSLLLGIRQSLSKLGSTILSPFKTAFSNVRKSISDFITNIKNKFKISLKLGSSIKFPHISASWKKASGWKQTVLQKLGLDGLPSFSVKWYKTGGIFDSASLIGVGEAGAEAVVPLDNFWDTLANYPTQIAQSLNGGTGGELNLVINLDGETIAKSTVNYVNNQTVRYGVSPLTV